MGRHAQPLEEKFWPHVVKTRDCWFWTGVCMTNGYGQIGHNGKQIGAHRASLMIHGTEIPEGLLVLHKCHYVKCVNPDHLYLGNNQDNSDDIVMRSMGVPITDDLIERRRADCDGRRRKRMKIVCSRVRPEAVTWLKRTALSTGAAVSRIIEAMIEDAVHTDKQKGKRK